MKFPLLASTVRTLFSIGLALPLTLSACSEKGPRRPNIDPAPEAQALKNIGASFLVETETNSEEANRARIAIARNALGKEFLLQSGITIMPYLGTSNGNLSRIVTFRVIDGALWMFDAAEGKVVTSDIPQTFLLAKFPIKSQTLTHIYFDFNAGMTSLLVGEEWRASDFSGTDVKADATGIKTRLSYLEEASISASNELIMRQIAQVDMPKGTVGGDETETTIAYQQDHTTVEMLYYLTPYAPAPGFQPAVSEGFDTYGYFEVAPRFDDAGTPVIHATKFADGPITFAISANTPAEVRDAVRDGILYWNKSFGEERLFVVDAPAGITAPNFNYNIVQWVTWDDAGFAYADAQADPRTGQTMHAQVYMTSAFWVGGQRSAKVWLERVGATPGGGGPVSRPAGVGLNGFQGGHLCLADMTKDFTALLSQLVLEEADDARIKRITGDYIREVVAHEIGHTLGLRHNFAGSQAANFPVSDLETVFKDYAENGSAALDKQTSNSVMEYQTFLNSTISGDQILKSPTALPYDRQAILKLYTGSEPSDATPQPFCTDTLESVFVDCKVFDEGTAVPASLARSVKGSARILGLTTTVGTDVVPLIYLLDADMVADGVLEPYKESAALASAGTKLLSVRQMSGLPSSLEPVFQTQERDRLLLELTAAGGFDMILPVGSPLPDPGVAVFAPARTHLENRMTSKLLDILATPTQIVDHPLGEAFAVHLEKTVRLVALAEAGTPITVTVTRADGSTATVNLPQFKFSPELRAKAVALLKPGRGESQAFALEQNLRVKADLVAKVNGALGIDVAGADLATLPPEARRWVVENQSVLEALGR